MRQKFEHNISLLKLYKDDIIWANSYYFVRIDNLRLHSAHITYYIHWEADFLKPYLISNNEVKQLRRFWVKTNDIKTNHIAIKKFNRADYNPTSEESIIDYTIALESLFVPVSPKGEHIMGEKAYQFRINGSLVLSKCTNEDKLDIYNDLKELYKLRSSIVHGGSIKTQKYKLRSTTLDEFCSLIRNYTRNAILFLHRKGLLNNPKERQKFFLSQILQIKNNDNLHKR